VNPSVSAHHLFPLICLIASLQVFAAKRDTIPTWLDTVPPVIQIQPQGTYQTSIFHISFKANEQATIYYRLVSLSAAGRQMETYREPLTVMEEGPTQVFFYGEDIVGNKSRVDSMTYLLDSRPPEITVSPEPGRYRSAVTVRCAANEPCKFFFMASLIEAGVKPVPVPDSIVVKDSLDGYFVAIDKAGNKTFSRKMTYTVDSTTIRVDIMPGEGVYNSRKEISFKSIPPADVFYTFDPSAPPRLFMQFEKPVRLPYGNTLVRYYARNSLGWESEIGKSAFVVDTVPPKLRFEQLQGQLFDTLVFSTKEPTVIRYTLDATFPTETSAEYSRPVVVPRKGKCVVKAAARDLAGNRSELLEWEYKYDKSPPALTLSKSSGLYSGPLRVLVKASKPSSIFYTLDGSHASQASGLYKDGIPITKEGETELCLIAVDEAGNVSREIREDYVIDTKMPFVKVRVEEDIRQNAFLVTLLADEDADIFYEVNGRPSDASPRYKEKILMHRGQVLRYYGVDKAGNRSETRIMEDLNKPMVTVSPEGGVYKRALKIIFSSNPGTSVSWRLLPDTTFTVFSDSLVLSKEGIYTLEYFSENQSGLRSPLRRSEYVLDLTPPQTEVIVKKGNKDSVSVFFECSKKATIFYTLDGTNPAFSFSTRTVGNKFLLSRDRISIRRKEDVRLAFFAEDAAGNQSPIRVLDVFKPRAMPDVPAGPDRVYDRVLSVTLNTFDSKSIVYYARHGHVPSADSAVFSTPLTLMSSDTILAFAVDAAGYRGQVDTFVYLIDLPPSPEFAWTPSLIRQGATVEFDASATIDLETPIDRLVFRWDFNGDGIFDTDFLPSSNASYTYVSSGAFKVTLEVRDVMKRAAVLSRELFVEQLCPPGMVSMARGRGITFCIDTYEWPNIVGEKPITQVSWVQAKIYCLDAGKRLCASEEWNAACRTVKKTAYPYGQKYQKGKCPSEGGGVYKSGSFSQCGDAGGAKDMTGNVWEWVEDKKGDYPRMLGGSFRFGETADCYLGSEGGVGLKSDEVGFRCCK
jgi:hypothetical protein